MINSRTLTASGWLLFRATWHAEREFAAGSHYTPSNERHRHAGDCHLQPDQVVRAEPGYPRCQPAGRAGLNLRLPRPERRREIDDLADYPWLPPPNRRPCRDPGHGLAASDGRDPPEPRQPAPRVQPPGP